MSAKYDDLWHELSPTIAAFADGKKPRFRCPQVARFADALEARGFGTPKSLAGLSGEVAPIV